MMPPRLKRSRLFKSRNNNGYLQLIGTACSLLFDTGQHIFFHFVQNSMEGAAFRLQVLLHPVGICLVSQQKKKKFRVSFEIKFNLSPLRYCTSKLSRLCLRVQMKLEISSFFMASVWVIFRRDS